MPAVSRPAWALALTGAADLADTLVGAITMAMSGNMVLPAGRLAPSIADLGRWDEPPPPARAPAGPTAGASPVERSTSLLSERATKR